MNTCAFASAANDGAWSQGNCMGVVAVCGRPAAAVLLGRDVWANASDTAASNFSRACLAPELLDAPVSNNSLAGESGHVRKNFVGPRPASNVLSSNVLPTGNAVAAEVDRVPERVEAPDQELQSSGSSSKNAVTALHALESGLQGMAWRPPRPQGVCLYGAQKVEKTKQGSSLSRCLTCDELKLLLALVVRRPRAPALCIVDPKPMSAVNTVRSVRLRAFPTGRAETHTQDSLRNLRNCPNSSEVSTDSGVGLSPTQASPAEMPEMPGNPRCHRLQCMHRVELSRLRPIQLRRARAQARDELAAEVDRVLERVEAPDQERVDAELVVLEHGAGDLLGRAD